ARCCRELLQAGCVFAAEHELAMPIVEGRQEVVEESGPDDAVDALRSKTFRELAQGEHRNRQIVDRPVADGQGCDPPLLNFSMLAAGKSALHRAELGDVKLAGEFRVERNLRASGIDKEGDLVAPVYAH